MKARRIKADWTAASFAKATGDPAVAMDSVDHLKRYIELLFHQGHATGKVAR